MRWRWVGVAVISTASSTPSPRIPLIGKLAADLGVEELEWNLGLRLGVNVGRPAD